MQRDVTYHENRIEQIAIPENNIIARGMLQTLRPEAF